MLNLKKIIIIKTLEKTITIFKLRGFLKIISFFKKYIQEFKQITKLLNNITLVRFSNY